MVRIIIISAICNFEARSSLLVRLLGRERIDRIDRIVLLIFSINQITKFSL